MTVTQAPLRLQATGGTVALLPSGRIRTLSHDERRLTRQHLQQALDRAAGPGDSVPLRVLAEHVGIRYDPLDRRGFVARAMTAYDHGRFDAAWLPDVPLRPPELPVATSVALDEWNQATRRTGAPPVPRRGRDVATMTLEERWQEVFVRTYPLLPGKMREEFLSVISVPGLLAGAAVALVAFAVSWAFGIGQAVSAILLVVGALSFGWGVFGAASDLLNAAGLVSEATSDEDLDRAAASFGAFLAVVGVAGLMALLRRGPGRAASRRTGGATVQGGEDPRKLTNESWGGAQPRQQQGPIADTERPMLPPGRKSSVVVNKLDPHESRFAQEIVDHRGGSFVGNGRKGEPGIDGTLDGRPVSLKETGGGLQSVLKRASEAESQAKAAGYTGIPVYIKAQNVSSADLIDYGRKGGLVKIPNQGTVSSISVLTKDGWVIFPGKGP